jgi:hypothetical protein
MSFIFGGNEATVMFATEGEAAGNIRITAEGDTMVDKAL